MKNQDIAHVGKVLFEAWKSKQAIAPLSQSNPDLTLEDAYQISLSFLTLRQHAGATTIGKKIGVTSKAVQEMLDVHQPDFGYLTNDMLYVQNQDMPISKLLISPRAEGEIAFVLKKDLIGPNVTVQDVLNATDYVVPCFEVVDSRIKNWQITIEDTVADNASCGLFVLGDTKTLPSEVDFEGCEMIVTKNGKEVSRGLGSAAMGSPLACVAWLANTFSRLGNDLKAGEIILSGSLVPLEPVTAGDTMTVEVSGLGSATVNFT